MQYKDYYKILGVERNADQDTIRKAYRRLAAKYHPDRNKEKDAEERFKEVNEANEVLSDPEKRQRYDTLGSNWQAGDQFRTPPNWGGMGGGAGGFDPSFFEDLARQASNGRAAGGAGFSDFFENLFGGGFREPNANKRQTTTKETSQPTASLALTIEEAIQGVRKTIRLPSGESLQVQIPAGVTDGKKIRLAGKGKNGSDLFLQIKLNPHALYRVEGNDLYLDLPVAPWEMALEASVEVPTPTGKVNLKIPANSQTGKKLRLKGRGLGTTPVGDLYVVLVVNLPQAVTGEQKAAYAAMQAAFNNWNPRQHLS
ncbi:MAG: DnaJ C-terminal domain-containing protein [Thiotrichaceae bacterium]|uniref:DnaJ C-terminal domain-containing protein n=1 Tax=Candidatus Thiocaldithrix dubininis TaxID=3080823 RepID=A0AA95KI11_9GAMM|nr:MAG: DnaJ C-terminal domain-containing protein [Candidatus Thiocaldithrix dubininis]